MSIIISLQNADNKWFKMDYIYLILNLIKNKPYIFEDGNITPTRESEIKIDGQFITQTPTEAKESEV